MSMLQILPLLAYAGGALFIVFVAYGGKVAPILRWATPGIVGAAFIAFSLFTLVQDGMIQFWLNHTANLAGNQVWLDLIIAVTLAFYLIAPRARAVGMPLLPWALAVIVTACMALLPMLARLIWLEQTQPAETAQ